MSFIQKAMRYIFVVFIVSSIATIQALTPQEGNIYQEEFKALKEKRFHKVALDRHAPMVPSQLMANIESAQEVGPIGRLFRVELFQQNTIAVTGKHMPFLHAYVREVCEQLGMSVPTVYITKNKTGIFGGSHCQSDSIKKLMSSGAILIGQDLLLDVSQKAIEAAIAHELCRIKYNHWNKQFVLKWIAPAVVSSLLPTNTGNPLYAGRDQLLSFLLVRMIISKEFEKQADQFVYATMNNAEGLVELCTYWQQKEHRVDTDYDAVSDCLREADISLFDYVINGFGYHLFRTGHRLHKVGRWIMRSTFLGPKQNYQVRINAAQRYSNIQNQINSAVGAAYNE